jgi:hypothetical protein
MAELSGSGLWALQCIDLNEDGERGFQRVPSQLHCDWYGTNGQTITVLDGRSGFAEKLIAPALDDTFQKNSDLCIPYCQIFQKLVIVVTRTVDI